MKKDKKIRYIKQRDGYNCGPVALINVAKWAGLKYTHKDINKIRRMCKSSKKEDSGYGVAPAYLNIGLSKLMNKTNKEYTLYGWPTLGAIDAHLKCNGILLVAFRDSPYHSGHYFVIEKKTKNGYKVLNKLKESISYIRRSTLKRIVKSRYWDLPMVWFIK